jgi:hypothetical protein
VSTSLVDRGVRRYRRVRPDTNPPPPVSFTAWLYLGGAWVVHQCGIGHDGAFRPKLNALLCALKLPHSHGVIRVGDSPPTHTPRGGAPVGPEALERDRLLYGSGGSR